jgi:hypothetical protein
MGSSRTGSHSTLLKLLAAAYQSKQTKYRGDIHCFDESEDLKTRAASTFVSEKHIEQLKIFAVHHQPRRHILPFPGQCKNSFCLTKRHAKILREIIISLQ